MLCFLKRHLCARPDGLLRPAKNHFPQLAKHSKMLSAADGSCRIQRRAAAFSAHSFQICFSLLPAMLHPCIPSSVACSRAHFEGRLRRTAPALGKQHQHSTRWFSLAGAEQTNRFRQADRFRLEHRGREAVDKTICR